MRRRLSLVGFRPPRTLDTEEVAMVTAARRITAALGISRAPSRQQGRGQWQATRLLDWLAESSGRASGARRRVVQRGAGRGVEPGGWGALRGGRHGLWLPQVHRLSGTDPGTGRRRARAEPLPQGSPQSARGGNSTETVSAASSLDAAARVAEADLVERRPCDPNRFLKVESKP